MNKNKHEPAIRHLMMAINDLENHTQPTLVRAMQRLDLASKITGQNYNKLLVKTINSSISQLCQELERDIGNLEGHDDTKA